MRSLTTVLPLAALALAACAHTGSTPGASLDALPAGASTESRELTADAQVAQALSRLTFGARPGDAAAVRAMGVDRWIARQLRPEQIDDAATDAFLARHYATLERSPAELARDYPPPNLLQRRLRGDSVLTRADSAALMDARRRANQLSGELLSAKVARAAMSERQLQEVMADFWENHFNVFIGKGQPMRYYLPEYDRDVIRPRALGKFRDLLGAVAKSPAMLFYLDNAQSMADSLHPTLAALQRPGARPGVRRPGRAPGGIPGGIDPRRVPRTPGRAPLPRPGLPGAMPGARPGAMPNDSAGRLAQLAQQRRARGLNENYARELLELHTLGVDGGYTQQDVIEVARALTGWSMRPPQLPAMAGRAMGGDATGFIFRPEMHDAGEKHVLGHTLKAGRGIEDGEQVLDILARHPSTARFIARKLAVRFVSDSPPPALVERAAATFQKTDGDIREVVRTIVTSPEFFSRQAYRAKVKSPFEVVVSALRAMSAEPDTTPRTALLVARLGQPLFGHQAPNGYPETGEAWMNTGAILNRINFGMAAAAGRVPGVSLARWPLAATLRTAPREQQVDGVIAALLGGDASPDTRQILLTGEHPLLAARPATDSVPMRDAGAMRPGAGRGVAPGAPPGGFAQIVGLALGSPEFQRR